MNLCLSCSKNSVTKDINIDEAEIDESNEVIYEQLDRPLQMRKLIFVLENLKQKKIPDLTIC